MSVYTYARYSTDRQTEASTADQQRRCHEYAAARGWRIVGDYVDEAISGAAFGNRPGVLAVLPQLGRGDVLLVADLSRLSRSQELAPLLDRVRYRGARVIGVLDGFDSDSPTARMQAGLSGIMSDEMRASIRARVHSALDMRAKDARPTGGRAYGFDNAGELVEPQASIAREIFARYAAGETMKGLANDLNSRGVPSPGATWNRGERRTDGRWLVSGLHAILHNEKYAGRVIWNRSTWVKNPETGKRERRERPESEWVVREGPALVDAATWRRVQARLADRGRYGGGSGGAPRYLLSGLLVCGSCGSRMVATGKAGSHYVCGTHHGGGRAACSMELSARRDVSEAVILRPILEEVLSEEAVRLAARFIREWHRQDRVAAVQRPGADVEEVDARIARLERQVATGALDREDVAASLEALHARRVALARAVWRKGAAGGPDAGIPAERAYREVAERVRLALTGKNLAAARMALQKMIGDVPVRPATEGRYLVAEVGLSIRPLLAEVGLSWSGSGAGICPHETRHLSLLRAA